LYVFDNVIFAVRLSASWVNSTFPEKEKERVKFFNSQRQKIRFLMKKIQDSFWKGKQR